MALLKKANLSAYTNRHLIILKFAFLIGSLFFNEITLASEAGHLQAVEEKHSSGWELSIDNDAFWLLPLDQDYTGGIALTLYGRRATKYSFSMDRVRQFLDEVTGIEKYYKTLDSFRLHSMGFGLTSYTPVNTSDAAPILDDHPYASLFFLSNTQQVVAPLNGVMFQSTWTLGVLGLDLAEKVGDYIHTALRQETAKGWHNQISSGGELTAKYTLMHQTVRASHYGQSSFDYDIKTTREANIGYKTDISFGIAGRFGRIHSPWWSFNPHQSDYNNIGVPNSSNWTDSHVGELYGWGGINVRYRFYDAIFQGQFRDSAVTFSGPEMNPLVGEAWLGITKHFESHKKLSFVLRARTSELKSASKRNPLWASIIYGVDTH